jgi:hypothetical protein
VSPGLTSKLLVRWSKAIERGGSGNPMTFDWQGEIDFESAMRAWFDGWGEMHSGTPSARVLR